MPQRLIRPALIILSLFCQSALDVFGYESVPKAVIHSRGAARRRVAAPVFGSSPSESNPASSNGRNLLSQTAGFPSFKRASDEFGGLSNQITSSFIHPPTSGYLFCSPNFDKHDVLPDATGRLPPIRLQGSTGGNFHVFKKPVDGCHYLGFHDVGTTSGLNAEGSLLTDYHHSEGKFDVNQNINQLLAPDFSDELMSGPSLQRATDTICPEAGGAANTQQVTYAPQFQHQGECWPHNSMERPNLDRYKPTMSIPDTYVKNAGVSRTSIPAFEFPHSDIQSSREQMNLSDHLVTMENMNNSMGQGTDPPGALISGSSSEYDIPTDNYTPLGIQNTKPAVSNQRSISNHFSKSASLNNSAPTSIDIKVEETDQSVPPSACLNVFGPQKRHELPHTNSSEFILLNENSSRALPCKRKPQGIPSQPSSPVEYVNLELKVLQANHQLRPQPPGDTPDGELKMSNANIKVYAWIGATYDRNEMRFSASMYDYMASFTTQLRVAQNRFILQCGKCYELSSNWLSKMRERNRNMVKKFEKFVRQLWFLNKCFLEALGTRVKNQSYEKEQKSLLEWLLEALLDPKRGFPLFSNGNNEFQSTVLHLGQLQHCLQQFIDLDENPDLWKYNMVTKGVNSVPVKINKEAAAMAELAVYVLGSYRKETNYRKWRAIFSKDNDYLEFLVTLSSNLHRKHFSDVMENKIRSLKNTYFFPWERRISDKEWKAHHNIIQMAFKDDFEKCTTKQVQVWVEG